MQIDTAVKSVLVTETPGPRRNFSQARPAHPDGKEVWNIPKIKKLGTLLINTSNPANMHILDINSSIDAFNASSNLHNLLALQRKVKGYEFAKLTVAQAIELNQQIDRELDAIKKANDLEAVSRLLTATVNSRAGGRTLQIQGGGGDDLGEGGGFASWKEHGFEAVCQLDAHHAMTFEEVAQELALKVANGTLSSTGH